MPEDSKKNQDKRKNDPKEQRKPRNSRNQSARQEKKTETVEESKPTPKVPVPQKPPVYEDPGPEFYKNLKRETDEILKITEEENSKYKKKEIQSNWSKYEMPIESYEEIEEQDAGADYEKLIQAPLSIGGHFQFKHEKSWDINTGPSLYDKYFEIDMENLSLAVSTIPFYERNCIEKSLFSETDILSMDTRATKYKQKYYDDKSYSTPETEALDRTLNNLKKCLSNDQAEEKPQTEKDESDINEDRSLENDDDIHLDSNNQTKTDNVTSPSKCNKVIEIKEEVNLELKEPSIDNTQIDEDDILDDSNINKNNDQSTIENIIQSPKELLGAPIQIAIQPVVNTKKNDLSIAPNASKCAKIKTETKPKENPVDVKKNPVIESPEDLEKWLDDFLDG